MKKRLLKAILGCLGFLLAQPCPATNKKPEITDLCTLAKHPIQFDRKLVQLDAVVQSDGVEHTGLIDELCPDKGIALSIPNKANAKSGARNLINFIFRYGQMGTVDKHIAATIVGTFLYWPGKMPNREIVVDSVYNIEIYKNK